MAGKFNYKKFRKEQIKELIGFSSIMYDDKVIIDILLDKIIEQQDYICNLRQSYARLSRVFESYCSNDTLDF